MQHIIQQLNVNNLIYGGGFQKELSRYFAKIQLPVSKQIDESEKVQIFINASIYYETRNLIEKIYVQEVTRIKNRRISIDESKLLSHYIASFQEKMTLCAQYEPELLIMVFLAFYFLLKQEIIARDLELKQKRSFTAKTRNRIRFSLASRLCKEFERVIRYSLPFKIANFQFASYMDLLTPLFLAETNPAYYLKLIQDYMNLESPVWTWERYMHVYDTINKSTTQQTSMIGGIALNKEMLGYQEINKVIKKYYPEFLSNNNPGVLWKILKDADCMREMFGPKGTKLKKPAQRHLFFPVDLENPNPDEILSKVIDEYDIYCRNYPFPVFQAQAVRAELLHHIANRFKLLTHFDGQKTIDAIASQQLVYMPDSPFLYDSSKPDRDKLFKYFDPQNAKDSGQQQGKGMDQEKVENAGLEADPLNLDYEESDQFPDPSAATSIPDEELANHAQKDYFDSDNERKGSLPVEDEPSMFSTLDQPSRPFSNGDEALGLNDDQQLFPDQPFDSEDVLNLSESGKEIFSPEPGKGSSTPSFKDKTGSTDSSPSSPISRSRVAAKQESPVKSLPILLLEGKIDVEEYFIRTSQINSDNRSNNVSRVPDLTLTEGDVFARESNGKIVPATETDGTIRFTVKNKEINIQIKEKNEWFTAFSRIKLSQKPFSGKLQQSYLATGDHGKENKDISQLKDYLFQILMVDGKIYVYFD